MDDPRDTVPLAEAGAAPTAGGPPGSDPPEERPPEPSSGEPARAPGRAAWRLRRSVRDRKLKGVAGGIAAASDVDPTLVRLLFAAAALSGWGIVAYIVLAVALQDETTDDPAQPLPREQRRTLRIGLAIAAAVAVSRLFDGRFLGGDGTGLPFILIAVGAAVLWSRRDDRGAPPDPSTWAVVPAAAPLGAGIDWGSTSRDLLRLAAAFVAVGALLALLAGGFLVAVGAVPMRLPLLPGAIGSAALVTLVVSVIRRARPAHLLCAGAALLVAAGLAAGLASFPGGIGDRTVTIGPRTPLLDSYEHGVGSLVLDLSDVRLATGESHRVVAKVGVGELTVIVPAAATTDVLARIGTGTADLFGRQQGGVGIDATASHGGLGDAGRLDLDLRAGVGQVRVTLASEPTFGVSCSVPQDAAQGAAPSVACPHPPPLAGSAMTCSVVLVEPGGGLPGEGFCRRLGAATPPSAGSFAATCTVPSEGDLGTCAGFTPGQRDRLEALHPPGAPAPPPVGGAPATPDGGSLVCGPPDGTGARTCTSGPAPSTSTTAAMFRCTQAAGPGRLTCVPG